MKTVLLAGGYGTRISEESSLKPKPMVEIGGQPILWHIMKIYSAYGYNDFIVCLGYKGYVIKEFFADYFLHTSDVTFDLTNNSMTVHNNHSEPWRVTLVDTGLDTMTGGRIKRIQKYVDGEPFMLTYGDGVSDVDIKALVDSHQRSGRLATITSVQPAGRFGRLIIDGSTITGFSEKVRGDEGWINGGFMVCEPAFFDYIDDSDDAVLEKAPLENLASDGQLNAYKHYGFWQPMDTLREKIMLEDLWMSDQAPWKIWDK